MGIQFNCGEFRPGLEPLYTGGVGPIIPPVYIPEPPIFIPPFFPRFPTGGGGGPPLIPTFPPSTGRGGAPTGAPSGTVPFARAPGPPGSIPPGITRPITTGTGPQKYRCNEVKFYCPQDSSLPEEERRVKEIRRFCVICNQVRNELGQFVFPNDCIYNSLQECQVACTDSLNLNLCLDPTIGQIPNQIRGGGGEPLIPVQPNVQINANTNFSQIINQFNRPTGSGGEITPVNIAQEITNNTPLGPLLGVREPELYSLTLNFFNVEPTPNTSLVTNSNYLNIFNNLVSQEVGYLLERQNYMGEWDETILQNITLEKIALSININLLEAFSRIHYPGGQLVGVNNFLEMIRRHMFMHTLDTVDPSYFIEVANRQRQDHRLQFVGTSIKEYSERYALGLMAEGAISLDSTKEQGIKARQLRRQRRLNTDIRAKIPIETLEGECGFVFLENEGVCVTNINLELQSLPTGEGDGYYLYADTIENDCQPLITTSDLSSTYFVSQETRFNALTLFGVTPGISITSNSLQNQNELTEGAGSIFDSDGVTTSIKPLFFYINLSSVQELPTDNPLIYRTKIEYNYSDDSNFISNFLESNGFSVTRLNIDIDDPLYTYIYQTSSLFLEQNDIVFKSINNNTAGTDNVRLARTIPFGLIISPVKSSKYNPFGGFSNIISYSGVVTRKLNFMPTFEFSDKDQKKSPLKEVNLYNTTGDLKIGIVEENDSQNYTYLFSENDSSFTDTYYNNGVYSSLPTPVSSHGISYLVKDVIDYISNNYDNEEVTWYDVYRRMPLKQIGELFYNSNKDLLNNLERGYRNNLKLIHVLNTPKDQSELILSDDDITIFSKQNATYN